MYYILNGDPTLKHHYPHQDILLAIICGTPVLASIFVGLRLYGRWSSGSRIGWDDKLVVLAAALSLALIGPSYIDVKMWHKGLHIWQIPAKYWEPDLGVYYVINMSFNQINLVILPLVKASIILLLLRIGSVIDRVRIALYAVMVFNILTCVIPWFLLLFTCPPLTGNTWKPRTFGGAHCLTKLQSGHVLIFVNCTSLLTDLLVFPIPFIIASRAQSVGMRARVLIVLLFASSLAVTGIGAVKIYFTYRDRLFNQQLNLDWTYPIDFCIHHVENNVAIIVACVPGTRQMIRGVWTNGSKKSRSSDRPYSFRYRSHSRSHRLPTDDSIIRETPVASRIDPMDDREMADMQRNVPEKAYLPKVSNDGATASDLSDRETFEKEPFDNPTWLSTSSKSLIA